MLSYAREHEDDRRRHDVIVCVNNLSRFPQPVELDLRRWEGMVPVELLGGVPFPRDRRAAVPPHPGRLRLLLVPARRRRTTRRGHP